MNRLTVGILLSFAVVLAVTSLNYTPGPIVTTSQVSSDKSTPACAFGSARFGCAQKGTKVVSTNTFKPCCTQKAQSACAPDCTKPCCASNKGT
mgnify:FL=1